MSQCSSDRPCPHVQHSYDLLQYVSKKELCSTIHDTVLLYYACIHCCIQSQYLCTRLSCHALRTPVPLLCIHNSLSYLSIHAPVHAWRAVRGDIHAAFRAVRAVCDPAWLSVQYSRLVVIHSRHPHHTCTVVIIHHASLSYIYSTAVIG